MSNSTAPLTCRSLSKDPTECFADRRIHLTVSPRFPSIDSFLCYRAYPTWITVRVKISYSTKESTHFLSSHLLRCKQSESVIHSEHHHVLCWTPVWHPFLHICMVSSTSITFLNWKTQNKEWHFLSSNLYRCNQAKTQTGSSNRLKSGIFWK